MEREHRSTRSHSRPLRGDLLARYRGCGLVVVQPARTLASIKAAAAHPASAFRWVRVIPHALCSVVWYVPLAADRSHGHSAY